MSGGEASVRVFCSRRLVNFLTALLPTMEGLFLVTVLDGKTGEVLFRYDPAASREMAAFLDYLIACHPSECRLAREAAP